MKRTAKQKQKYRERRNKRIARGINRMRLEREAEAIDEQQEKRERELWEGLERMIKTRHGI